jgi:hypothetical protein
MYLPYTSIPVELVNAIGGSLTQRCCVFIAIVLCLSSTFSSAQDNLFSEWFKVVSATQAEQPRWITPLATTTSRLDQEFRYGIQWQAHNSDVVTDNYGVSKVWKSSPRKVSRSSSPFRACREQPGFSQRIW